MNYVNSLLGYLWNTDKKDNSDNIEYYSDSDSCGDYVTNKNGVIHVDGNIKPNKTIKNIEQGSIYLDETINKSVDSSSSCDSSKNSTSTTENEESESDEDESDSDYKSEIEKSDHLEEVYIDIEESEELEELENNIQLSVLDIIKVINEEIDEFIDTIKDVFRKKEKNNIDNENIEYEDEELIFDDNECCFINIIFK